MSLGRYIDLSRNAVQKIQTFVTAAGEREQKHELRDLSRVSEEDFVIIKGADLDELPITASSGSINTSPLELSAVQKQYLKDKPAALNNILRKLKNEGYICKFDLEGGRVQIKPTGNKDPRQALQIIRESVVEMDFPAAQMALMDDSANFLPAQDPDELQALVVKVGDMVKLVGLASDIDKVGGSLGRSIGSLEARARDVTEPDSTKIIPLAENCFNYMYKYKMAELKGVVKGFTRVRIVEGRNHFKLVGPAAGIKEATVAIMKAVDVVKTFSVALGPHMNVAVVAVAAEEIGKKYECSITFQQNFGAMGGAPAHRAIEDDPNFPSLSLSVLGLKDTRIRIVMNAIEKQKAHVIVNTTNSSLDLNNGRGVSWCIWNAGGQSVQDQLKEKYPQGIKHGEVAVSGPGDIKTCKTILHGALPAFPKKGSPDFDNEAACCFKWLVNLVFNCLIKASSSEAGYRTIAFPALGTGQLEYPPLYVVQLMYKAIKLFIDDRRSGQIKDVILVIYPETKLEVKQMFLAHRQTYRMNTRHVSSVDEIHEENKKEENQKKCEFRTNVGKILLQVVNGRIHESCDVSEAVLVLWSEPELSDPKSNPGLTCTDVFKKDWKCSSYVSELDESEVAADTTTLSRRTLIHVYCKDTTDQTVSQAIVSGMREATKLKCLTMTIPIAADGHLARKPRKTAQLIISALKQSKTDISVVTLAVEDNGIFVTMATKISSLGNLQEPADIDKTPIAVDQWTRTFAEKASEHQSSLQTVMTMTNENSMLLITSDSETRNELAANEIREKLATRLHSVMQQKTL